jgi:hypothetical protein
MPYRYNVHDYLYTQLCIFFDKLTLMLSVEKTLEGSRARFYPNHELFTITIL